MVKKGTQRKPPRRDRLPQQHRRRATSPLRGGSEANG